MNFTMKELGLQLESLPGELWREVPQTNRRYYVSNMGRLMTTKYRTSDVASVFWPAIMKPAKDAGGYLRTMIVIGGRCRTIKMHRLVAQVWIPNPDGLPTVNHRDFNKENNAVSNLEWMTQEANSKHYQATGMQPVFRGAQNWKSRLTEDAVREIKYAASCKTKRKWGRKALAEKYGVSVAAIKDVLRGRSWRHVQ